jgi:hypothetical protein
MDIGNNNSQSNLSGESTSGGFSPKGSGRIFKGGEEETAPKLNLDEEIEKNIKIRTMPKSKAKPIENSGGKQNKAVGAIIMVVGLLVLLAAVYLAYVFLIKPQSNNSAKNTTSVNNTVSKGTESPTPKKTEPAKTNETTVTPIGAIASSSVPSTSASTSTATSVIGQPINQIASSTTSNVPTSSVPIAGAPIGAKSVNGLSAAEKALFGTDLEKTDSDGDGYSDQSEIMKLYNPAGAGKITDNQHISAYQNANNGYSIDYPKNWKVQNLENGDTLIFTAADNSLIEVISQPNPQKQTIKDWYNAQFSEKPAVDADITTQNGWQGIFQEEKFIFYLVDSAKSKIYTISYVPATEKDLSYYNIFLMMINSFVAK